MFKQLPFGLSSAPYIFTKIMRPLVKKWGEGKSIVVYLDDGIGFAPTFSEALAASEAIKEDFHRSGFVPNVQKSVWVPAKSIDWLGYEIDLKSGTFCVPQRRISSIKQEIKSTSTGITTARSLARIVGKIMSASSLVLGNVANVMTKYLHFCIESRFAWDSMVIISAEARSELDFWKDNLDTVNVGAIGVRKECSRIVYSDASSTGYGGYLVDTGEENVQGMWDSSDALKSSTWRELRAVDLVLKSLVTKLSCRRTKWFTDNQAVSRITTRGSMKKDLQDIALSICKNVWRTTSISKWNGSQGQKTREQINLARL